MDISGLEWGRPFKENMRKKSKQFRSQVRVLPAQRKGITFTIKKAKMGISKLVLGQKFQHLVKDLKCNPQKNYPLAEIHDLLQSVTTSEFEHMVSEPARIHLEPYWENYVAAMVEHAAAQRGLSAPPWVSKIKPLNDPVFGSNLKSLRLYLLTHSPVSFRKRNIFIDATVGQRV